MGKGMATVSHSPMKCDRRLGKGPVLYTIGHSNLPMDQFLDLLQRHGIEVVVDVRSQPYSRYVAHFNRDPLRRALEKVGLSYVLLGTELGGRPGAADFYDDDGYVRYDRVAKAEFFNRGLARLRQIMSQQKTAILCSEENPESCHRHLLIGRVLAGEGVTMLHIRSDGRVQADSDLQRADRQWRQTTLFSDEEPMPWRSTRSVLPKRQPLSSSPGCEEPASEG